jgi:hypothetical protein
MSTSGRGRNPTKRDPRKKGARIYMVKGVMAQLMIRVRATGFGVRAALSTSAKSIFTMMGYIMKKRAMAIGIETW